MTESINFIFTIPDMLLLRNWNLSEIQYLLKSYFCPNRLADTRVCNRSITSNCFVSSVGVDFSSMCDVIINTWSSSWGMQYVHQIDSPLYKCRLHYVNKSYFFNGVLDAFGVSNVFVVRYFRFHKWRFRRSSFVCDWCALTLSCQHRLCWRAAIR